MRKELMLLSGVGAGAALMYMLDPDRGRRRRALVRDKAVSIANRMPDIAGKTARDISNRARGIVSEAGVMFRGEEVTDDILVQRVRAAMGRVVSHPHAIQVEARGGHVVLSGNILEGEADDLISCASRVRGVEGVEDRLTRHSEAGNVPDLQGGRVRPGYRPEFMQDNWSPAMRFVAGLAGSALTIYALKQKFPVACALGTIGLGLLARGATNTGLGSLVDTDALSSFFNSDGGKKTEGRAPGDSMMSGMTGESAPRPTGQSIPSESRNEPSQTMNKPMARSASAR